MGAEMTEEQTLERYIDRLNSRIESAERGIREFQEYVNELEIQRNEAERELEAAKARNIAGSVC
jgi:septal ring factor EnvC (AmiA/AmiB activator)